jgi:hypothetical protein
MTILFQSKRMVIVDTEAGVVVRSLTYPKRGDGDPRTMLRTAKWPSGEALNGSDAYDVAKFICPVRDKRARRG